MTPATDHLFKEYQKEFHDKLIDQIHQVTGVKPRIVQHECNLSKLTEINSFCIFDKNKNNGSKKLDNRKNVTEDLTI